MKQGWSKIQAPIKNGSELALGKEPHWWKYLDSIFSEKNEVINVSSSAGETSFVRNEDEGDDDDEEGISNDGCQESDIDIGQENMQESMQIILTLVKVEKQINKKLL